MEQTVGWMARWSSCCTKLGRDRYRRTLVAAALIRAGLAQLDEGCGARGEVCVPGCWAAFSRDSVALQALQRQGDAPSSRCAWRVPHFAQALTSPGTDFVLAHPLTVGTAGI
ncbi:hypothetical protein [Belnapia sp. F-4-1]|uniref:hypothetical protein n=1 Tax=Belnapia sp. F-4-1 TaxID=1545443 RepID=UPI0005B81268|nr:hypothetical protein [Belnapia sp. F-4-1]